MPSSISTSDELVRSFLALPLGTVVREALMLALQEWASRVPPEAVRWVRADQLHLTLKFFGDLPGSRLAEVQTALDGAIAGIGKMRLAAECIGCFPQIRDPRILWIGITGDVPALAGLQRRVEDCAAPWVPREERAFQPHVTLGRVKRADAATRAALRALLESGTTQTFGTWEADRLELMRSRLTAEGSQYSVLRTWQLSD